MYETKTYTFSNISVFKKNNIVLITLTEDFAILLLNIYKKIGNSRRKKKEHN